MLACRSPYLVDIDVGYRVQFIGLSFNCSCCSQTSRNTYLSTHALHLLCLVLLLQV